MLDFIKSDRRSRCRAARWHSMAPTVLAISAAHLPNIEPLVIDTGRGKRSAQLDLRTGQGREKLKELIRGADVFLQAYRPGALAELGFTTEEIVRTAARLDTA